MAQAGGPVDGEERLGVVMCARGHRDVVASKRRDDGIRRIPPGKAMSAASANSGRLKCASAVATPTSGEEPGHES